MQPVIMVPIGFVRSGVEQPPRHHSISEVEADLMIDEAYRAGLAGLRPGRKIVVLFHFHRSPAFEPGLLLQHPPHREEPSGVFNLCSPVRPNPIGLDEVEVLEVEDGRIRVRGIDMLDGTPILDIKPAR